MAGIAAALAALTTSPPDALAALASAQRTADTAGADVLVLHLAGLLAWLAWAWGTVGLTLTALSARPGRVGSAAGSLLRRVLPRGARTAAALALGIGLGITPPALAGEAPLVAASAAVSADAPAGAALSGAGAVPDWPGSGSSVPTPPTPPPTAGPRPGAEGPPDWPRPPAAGKHVVVRGDCLWHIAASRLTAEHGRAPSDAQVATAVVAWWQANVDVIGPDPDRLLPGQVLRPPARP